MVETELDRILFHSLTDRFDVLLHLHYYYILFIHYYLHLLYYAEVCNELAKLNCLLYVIAYEKHSSFQKKPKIWISDFHILLSRQTCNRSTNKDDERVK